MGAGDSSCSAIRGTTQTNSGGISANSPLGRLERVDLREIWTSEATSFTPWLAREENLAALGEALDIELELEAQEKSVGPFRADILCKDSNSDHWVLVENQLERTDHTHLGQLLTYAAGLQAATIVWIGARFTDEHRAALDWLNAITDDDFRFFGLEVELWRIGGSAPAPKFNIVSQPNDWSRSVHQAARAIDEADLSETKRLQLSYWTEFHSVLDAAGGPVFGSRKPQPLSWMNYSIGRGRFSLAAVMQRPTNQIRAELYISGLNAKAFFGLLKDQKEAVEQELGYPLEWEELPEGQDCRISCYLRDVDPENEDDWRHQHDWLANCLNDLHRVFAQRVKALDLEDWRGGDADEEAIRQSALRETAA